MSDKERKPCQCSAGSCIKDLIIHPYVCTLPERYGYEKALNLEEGGSWPDQ